MLIHATYKIKINMVKTTKLDLIDFITNKCGQSVINKI